MLKISKFNSITYLYKAGPPFFHSPEKPFVRAFRTPRTLVQCNLEVSKMATAVSTEGTMRHPSWLSSS